MFISCNFDLLRFRDFVWKFVLIFDVLSTIYEWEGLMFTHSKFRLHDHRNIYIFTIHTNKNTVFTCQLQK